MPAPLGNTNNKKWNCENAQELINDVSEYIKNNPENDQNWDEICTVIHWIDDNLKR